MQVNDDDKSGANAKSHVDSTPNADKDDAAKEFPSEAKADDGKGDSNSQSATLDSNTESYSTREAATSSNGTQDTVAPKQELVLSPDCIFTSVDETLIARLKVKHVNLGSDVNNPNVSPSDSGDFTQDDLINLKNNISQEACSEDNEEDLNLVIDISNQINSEKLEFSKPKQEKKI